MKKTSYVLNKVTGKEKKDFLVFMLNQYLNFIQYTNLGVVKDNLEGKELEEFERFIGKYKGNFDIKEVEIDG